MKVATNPAGWELRVLRFAEGWGCPESEPGRPRASLIEEPPVQHSAALPPGSRDSPRLGEVKTSSAPFCPAPARRGAGVAWGHAGAARGRE